MFFFICGVNASEQWRSQKATALLVAWRSFVTILLLGGGLLGGCSSRSLPVKTLIEFQSLDDDLEPMSEAQVVSRCRERFDSTLVVRRKICEILESINDDASAEVASQNLFEFGQARRREKANAAAPKPILVEMDDVEFKHLELALKEINEPILKEYLVLQNRQKEALDRLARGPGFRQIPTHQIRNLISELLISEVIIESLQQAITGAPSFARRYPRHLRVTVVMKRAAHCTELGHYLARRSQASRVIDKTIDDFYAVELSPVRNLDEFASLIDIGTLRNVDPFHRIIEIELNGNDSIKLQAASRQRVLDQKNESAEKVSIANQEKKNRDEQLAAEHKIKAESQRSERIALLSDCVSGLQRINSAQSCRDELQLIRIHCQKYHQFANEAQRAADQYKQLTGVALNMAESELEWMAKIDSELARLAADTKIRAVLSASFGKDVDAKRMLASELPFRNYSNPAEDRQHPDFFAANLLDLTTNNYSNCRAALQRLARIDPQELTDIKLRKEITCAIRDLAIEERGSFRDEALEPLTVWAGRYCVPFLGKMLEYHNSPSDEKKIFDILLRFASDESAQVLCQSVGDRTRHDAACQALVKMGSVAETAVMELAPDNDAKKSLSAVLILGEIGTQKSLDLLRKAQSSTNPEVRQAASQTARKIKQRTSVTQTEK